MFEKILYPTDFSDVSIHALKHCIPKLIEMGAREVYLLHVIDLTVAEFEAFELEEIYRKKLEKLKDDIEVKDAKIDARVVMGLPSIEIAEAAEKNDVDLIVIPSAGENIWRTMFMGSTASNLARTTKRPVLILRYEKDGERPKPVGNCGDIFRRPLVAVDFSKCSVRIVKTVRTFQELIEGCVLIHSVDYGNMDELERNIKLAKKNLEKTARGLKVPVEIEVLVGTASQSIIGMALAKNATLIVIGKKGRSVLKDLLLGSTAERVIRDSKAPVLLVPCR